MGGDPNEKSADAEAHESIEKKRRSGGRVIDEVCKEDDKEITQRAG